MLLLYPTKTCQLLLSVYCLLQLVQQRWICFEERGWDSQMARKELSTLAAPCAVEQGNEGDLWQNASLQNTTTDFEKMYLEKASRSTQHCVLLPVDDVLYMTDIFPVQLCCLRAAAAFILASCLLLMGELVYFSNRRKRSQVELGPCTSASLQTILVVSAATSLLLLRLEWPTGPDYPAIWFWMEMFCWFLALLHCSQVLFIGTWSGLEIKLKRANDCDVDHVKTIFFTGQPASTIEGDFYNEDNDY